MDIALMSIDDLLTGLFAALKLRGIASIRLGNNHFDAALEKLFLKLKKKQEQYGVRICFRIEIHSIYKNSLAVQNALQNAIRRRIIFLDASCLHINMAKEEAQLQLCNLPGGQTMYEHLANQFISHITIGAEPS